MSYIYDISSLRVKDRAILALGILTLPDRSTL